MVFLFLLLLQREKWKVLRISSSHSKDAMPLNGHSQRFRRLRMRRVTWLPTFRPARMLLRLLLLAQLPRLSQSLVSTLLTFRRVLYRLTRLWSTPILRLSLSHLSSSQKSLLSHLLTWFSARHLLTCSLARTSRSSLAMPTSLSRLTIQRTSA